MRALLTAPSHSRWSNRRAGVGLVLALMLAGCGTTETVTEQPAFYTNLAKTGKPVDAEAAASMISDYRTARGLSPVTIDPALNQIAQNQANAMA